MADEIEIIDVAGLPWPRLSQEWSLAWRSMSGGVSLTGREQLVVGPSPEWTARLGLRVLKTEERAFRAFVSRLHGRAKAIRLYPDCCQQTPLLTRLGVTAGAAVPHSDDSTFSDGTGYASAAPVFALAAAAAIYDTELVLTLGGFAAGLEDGDFLGVGGQLHIVTRVTASDAATMTVEIEPPLRAAAALGAEVTTRPSVVMRLAGDAAPVTSVNGRPATPQLDLVQLPELV